MKARPSFQFYPADWLRDPGLRSCSLGARGLWIDLLCFMHEAEPYGHLRINGHDLAIEALARMMGAPLKEVQRYLNELETAGVFSRTETGTIFSRRMVRDQELRIKRGEGGHLSRLNPSVPRKKDERKDTFKDTFSPSIGGSIGGSPSSSSSFSQEKTPPPPTGGTVGSDCDLTSEGLVYQPDDIQRIWNALPGVTPCKRLGQTIRRLIQRRLDEYPNPDWWGEFFQYVQTSPFLTGRSTGNKGPFHASLDWALKPTNLDKILAGNYDLPESKAMPTATCKQLVLDGTGSRRCGKPVDHDQASKSTPLCPDCLAKSQRVVGVAV